MAKKKMKGVRANKPNDSFGTVNNDALYKNKYREEVDKDDDDEVEEVQADPAEKPAATQKETETTSESFVEKKTAKIKFRYIFDFGNTSQSVTISDRDITKPTH